MTAHEKDFITVVSGLPRSGTSMMMRMLESGGMPVVTDGIRTADLDNPKGYYEYEPVKRLDRDTSWLPHAYGKVVKIIYIFLYNLPPEHRYKVVFMNRSLSEVIASQKVMLRARQEAGGNLADRQLMESFDSHLRKLQDWIEARENFKVLHVDYHRALAEPGRVAAEVSRFLGLPLDIEAMSDAIDPSLHRNRQEGV